jgi:hypothetical protein
VRNPPVLVRAVVAGRAAKRALGVACIPGIIAHATVSEQPSYTVAANHMGADRSMRAVGSTDIARA